MVNQLEEKLKRSWKARLLFGGTLFFIGIGLGVLIF